VIIDLQVIAVARAAVDDEAVCDALFAAVLHGKNASTTRQQFDRAPPPAIA
jgi:hypothetical protein